MTAIFTPEDTVALREDPTVTGLVEQSWRDIDSSITPEPREWIPHNGLREEDVQKTLREGQVPRGFVVVRLNDSSPAVTMVKESELLLKDRGLVTGDVVKRAPSDAQSGYVIQTDLQCVCRPIYSGQSLRGSEAWNHKPEDNEIHVSSEELTTRDFEVGKFVVYKGWVGEVLDVWEHVTVRLSNGSVVRVKKPQDLTQPAFEVLAGSNPRPSDFRSTKSLAKTIRDARRRVERDQPDLYIAPEVFYPGQKLSTPKSNLRLGDWVIGSYDSSQPNKVTVVEVHPYAIEVGWLTYNVFGSQGPNGDVPSMLDGHDLQEVTLFNRHNVSSSPLSSNDLGSRRSQGIVVGDYVTFSDPAGAAVKYSPDSPRRDATGVFRRIPRSMADGFDMNTFLVRETKQTVRIEWQDGSITNEASTNVIPYLNVDENDLWPGELCSLKSVETNQFGMIKLNQIGVVQSVNAIERMAKVRWFRNCNVSIFADNVAVMEPGSSLGELSDEITEVSVYEILAYSAITKRRGDLVLISPNEDVIAMQQARALDSATFAGGTQRITTLLSSGWNAERAASLDPQDISSTGQVRFFGEIINLGLDGQLTVRLGALDQVEDIKVPVTRVFVVVGGDDEDFNHGGGDVWDDGYSDMSEDMSSASSPEPIEETITYEGGQRLDDDNEDDWMTDDDDEAADDEAADDEAADDEAADDAKASEKKNGVNRAVNGVPAGSEADKHANGDVKMADADTVKPTDLLNSSEYDFSKFENKPEGFEILDENPPEDHHYTQNATSLSAPLLRRIRKEHKILASSLPDGIWVRTWSGRLDILRILILGPRATPYELAPFVLDVWFKDDFPKSPPQVFFHSWTNGVGRINPNLYEDGNVCLSILGTWPEGDKNEGWNKDRSSLLQVLVSLMGLVLVAQPYYNEAGFESLVGTEDTQFASQMYSEKAYCMAKGFVEHALRHPVASVHPIVAWQYVDPAGLGLLPLVVKESQEALARARENRAAAAAATTVNSTAAATAVPAGVPTRSTIRLSAGAEVLMKRFLPGLEKRLADLEAAA